MEAAIISRKGHQPVADSDIQQIPATQKISVPFVSSVVKQSKAISDRIPDNRG